MTTQMLQVQAATLDEARQELQKTLPAGMVVLLVTVLSDGSSKKVEAGGVTVQDAVHGARAKVPEQATVENTHVTRQATRETIQIAALEESEARQEAQVARPKRVEEVSMTAFGRKGFLGIGRRPNTYDLVITQPAAVTVTYRALASIRAEVGTPEEATYRARIRSEFEALQRRLEGETVGRIPNDGNAMYTLGFAFGKARMEAREAVIAKHGLTAEEFDRILETRT